MSKVNEEFLGEVLDSVKEFGFSRYDYRGEPNMTPEEAKKAILQHFQQEQEIPDVSEDGWIQGVPIQKMWMPTDGDLKGRQILVDAVQLKFVKALLKDLHTQEEVDRLIREAKISLLTEVTQEKEKNKDNPNFSLYKYCLQRCVEEIEELSKQEVNKTNHSVDLSNKEVNKDTQKSG